MVKKQRPWLLASEPRMRIRTLLPDLFLGDHLPGPLNSLTDVPGIAISTQEITSLDGSINTGVTCIIPRKDWFHKACYAGLFSFNGYGEMTRSHLIAEGGLLCSPIVLTGTFGIGAAHQGILQYGVETKDEARKKVKKELEKAKEEKDGSIIVVIATDAPLLPHQLTRIAKRATVGLS
ncbi:unnamed protein product [Aureobasidium vineae]|uniref:Uncharacterized protein n=1 Tax=Aureobasidium vineae TaxID=2773715 RepID=A0A9N8JK60_9PEZI|nr:unnamed protein product [Aureobasidium vineae]